MKRILLMYAVLLLTVLSYGQLWAQGRTISGKVTAADDGTALPGVNVLVKGTNAGTTTASDGRYSISAPDNATLVFSFIGLTSQEVAVGTRSVVDVVMQSDVKTLNEVVVTALGVERETKSLGYSVAQVDNELLTVGRTTNVVNALNAKVAGVRISGSNGMVGSSSAIFIRGFTTFTGSNQPLFVVDGIPINNGGGDNATQNGVSTSNRAIDLNQDDIESVSVLKGPAAAVLYGSRAAAGAILITTKKGQAGATRKNTVSYTGSYNLSEVNRFPDYQNEYAQGTSLAAGVAAAPVFLPNDDQLSWGPRIEGQTVASPYTAADRALLGLPDEVSLTAYPNSIRDVFRTGRNMQHTVAFQGAGEKSNYYFSYNFLNDTGILENNELTKHTFTANASTQLTTKLNVGTNISYVNNTSQRSQIGNQLSNPFFRGWFTPRNINLQAIPVQRPDGSQVFYNSNTDNPYWSLRNNLYDDEVNRVIGNVNLSYDILDWLNVNYRIGTDAYTHNIKTVDAIGARGGANHAVGGVGAVGDRHIYNQETSSYLNLRASRKISEDLGATLLVGNEVNIRTNTDNLLVGNTLVTRGYNNMRNATNYVPTYDQFRRRLVGVYADLQLDFRGWAFLGITGRNDWSSTFNPDKRSYFYPSITGSLVLSDMVPAIRGENDVLSFAKIRANYAKVGREAPVYGTDTYFAANNPSDGFGPQLQFPFLSLQGRTLANTAGNPELGPEFTASYEVGTDLRFFRNRVGIDLGYFKTISTDIILDVPIAGASGFTNQSRNAGQLESNGIELAVDITPVKTSSFTWNIAANWTRIRNTVVSLAPGVQNVTLGGFTTAQSRVQAGEPYGVLYANTLLRDDAGRLIVNDNGLPIADTRGVQRVGDPNPDWLAGITNTVKFKGVTATFLVDIRQGGDILSRNIGDLRRTGVAVETADLARFGDDGLPLKNYIIEGVRQSDGGANETAITAQQYYGNLYNFSYPGMFVFDASWVRLREASVFYSLPQSLLSKTPFGKAEIGLNGRNLLLFTKVPHIDPEVNLTGASNSQGLEFNALPQTRSYGAVLRFTF